RYAHIDLAFPASAALGIFSIEIIIAGGERAFDQRLAGRAVDVPPAFGHPASLRPVADSDADEVLRGVAHPEIGPRFRGCHAHCSYQRTGKQTKKQWKSHSPNSFSPQSLVSHQGNPLSVALFSAVSPLMSTQSHREAGRRY